MDGDSKICYQPASTAVDVQPQQVASQPRHKDYLVWSICNMLCCCLPIGIAALIFSIKTRDAMHLNDDSNAARHSRMTFKLNLASTLIGIILVIAIFVIYFVIGIQLYKGNN